MLQLFTFSFAFSQNEIAKNSEVTIPPKIASEVPLTTMEPSFVGGYEALKTYVRNNLQYPEIARKNGIEGTVKLEFYIKADGTIENVKVIESAHVALNAEAIRLVENMPIWNPAIRNGSPSSVKFRLPVRFEFGL